MSRHIRINSGRSDVFEALAELAEILVKCPGKIRAGICRHYGFSLDFSGSDPLLTYNGQAVGSGQVYVEGERFSFEVEPKNSGIQISDMLRNLGASNNKFYGALLQYHVANSDVKGGDFSYAYLLGLLNEIVNFGVHAFEIYSSKTRRIHYGSPVGRVLPKPFVQNQILGKFNQFECEELNNARLKQYACVFLQTGLEICKDLSPLCLDRMMSGIAVEKMDMQIRAKFAPYVTHRFSFPLLRSLARPPYPFGMKELLRKCLLYWQSKGNFSSGEDKNKLAFAGHYISLSAMFEDYAGLVFASALGRDYVHQSKRQYPYAVTSNIPDRYLEPDHIYTSDSLKQIVIVEVKYSNNLAPRENVAQLLSYITYAYPEWNGYSKVGMLVYPGESETTTRVSEFSESIFVANISSNLIESAKALEKWAMVI